MKCKQGGRVDAKFYDRLRWKAGCVTAGVSTLEQAKQVCAVAQKNIKVIGKREATDKRVTFLESLAEARAMHSNTKAEMELKQLMHHEQQHWDSRLIKAMNKKLHGGSLTVVIAPNVQGNWVEYNDKTGMEQAMVNEDSRRFSQAGNTPFVQEPLAAQVGRYGEGQGAAEILDGTFQIPMGMDPWAAKIISHLKRPEVVTNADPHSLPPRFITVEEHVSGWAKQRENTAAGKSGLGFQHFKANAMDEELALLDIQMANIPYQTGLSPE